MKVFNQPSNSQTKEEKPIANEILDVGERLDNSYENSFSESRENFDETIESIKNAIEGIGKEAENIAKKILNITGSMDGFVAEALSRALPAVDDVINGLDTVKKNIKEKLNETFREEDGPELDND